LENQIDLNLGKEIDELEKLIQSDNFVYTSPKMIYNNKNYDVKMKFVYNKLACNCMNIKQKGDRFELKIDRTKLTSADLGKLRLIISIDLTN
jgi:hypothetical protein